MGHARIAVLLLGVLPLASCSNQEIEKINKVSDKAWKRARAVASKPVGNVKRGTEQAGQLTADSDLAREIESRLRADRYLSGVSVNVQQSRDGIVLSGKVRNETQRRRAIELTIGYAGNVPVQDRLELVQ